MKTLHLSMIIIVGISVSTVFLFVIIYYLQVPEGPECMTSMTIIYGEPSKYNKTMIFNTLRENLSKNDLSHMYGANPWWEYVSIRQVDENGTIKIEIPTAYESTINMTEKIIGKIDGVSKIYPISSLCDARIVEKYHPSYMSKI